MIRAALKHRQAQQVGQGLSVWSNINVSDLVLLYQVIVEKLLHGEEVRVGDFIPLKRRRFPSTVKAITLPPRVSTLGINWPEL